MKVRVPAVAALLVVQAVLAAPAFAKDGNPPPPPPPPPPSGPSAPAGLAVSGSSQPITLSWGSSTGTQPIVAYNWQVGTSSTFASLVLQGSTSASSLNGPIPRSAKVSGLVNGPYFFRVDAVQAASDPIVGLVTGPWSAGFGFTVTGSIAGTLPAPNLTMPVNGSRYHPYEEERNVWDPVPGAAYYLLEYDNEPSFTLPLFNADYSPIFDIKAPIMFGEPVGDLWFRVRAVAADGTRSLPSNVRQTTISFTAPITPPGPLVAPLGGVGAQLPVTLDWGDDVNPQTYELQIGTDPTFAAPNAAECTGLDWCVRGIPDSQWTLPSDTTGTKYWRVRSEHGDISPTAPALSTWSAVGSFTVLPTPPRMRGFKVDAMTSNGFAVRASSDPSGSVDVYSGTSPNDSVQGTVTLDNVVFGGGTTVALSSSDPSVSVPPSVFVPSSCCFDATDTIATFPITVNSAVDTTVTVTAALPTGSRSVTLNVHPASLRWLQVGSGAGTSTESGGTSPTATVLLNGTAASTGANVTFASNNPSLIPAPAPVTIASGGYTTAFPLNINPLPSGSPATPVTITASWGTSSVTNVVTVHPPPTLLTPADKATVTAGSAVTFDWTDELTGDEVQISTTPTFATALVDQFQYGVSQYTTNSLPTGTLYWRARGYDDSFQPGTWSNTNTLTVSSPVVPPGPLAAPTLLSPANGSRVTLGTLATFTWTAVTGAASYQIQIDDSSSFTLPLTASATVTGTSFGTSTLPRLLLSWRVRAVDGSGNPGAWSSVRTVEIH